MNDVDMNDMFAMKLQSIIRRFNSRCRVIRIINDRYEKILDPRRKVHYYYDKIADISTWIKPPLLGKGDIEKISPTYTDDKAAEIITNLFRALYSLRKVQRLYAERVEAVKSQGAMKYIYRRKGAEETFRSLPRFMEGTLKHPLPGEDEESEEELESEESESEDDDNYDSDAERKERLENRKLPRSKAQQLIDEVEDNMGDGKGITALNRSLDLSGLGIIIPSSRLYTFTTLQVLNLSNNKLKKMSADFKYLMNLQKLDLRENKITSIPKEIEDLTRLNVCLFGHNRLNFIPGHFFKLFRMEIFDVSNNLFSPKAPVESGNMELLKDLKEWDISVGRLSKLSTYNVSHNGIEEWPIQLERLDKLTELDLSYNRIEMIPEVLAQMVSLDYLDVSNNALTELPVALFYLRNLKTLLLSNNLISSFNTQSLNPLDKLEILNISFNQFEILDNVLSAFQKVQLFKAENNQLKSIDASIGDMVSLTNLNLSCNLLTEIPNTLEFCSAMTDLNISKNKFIIIPSSISMFFRLINLDSSYNDISKGLTDDFFSKMSGLKRIDISNNKIEKIPTSLYSLKFLTYCNLSSNCINEIAPEISELESVVELYLQCNSIELIPSSISRLTKLEVFDISYNRIFSFPDEFGDLPLLRKFSAEHNRISNYQPCLWKLKKLASWNLNGNQVPFYIPTITPIVGSAGDGRASKEPITVQFLQRCLSEALLASHASKYISPIDFEQREIPEEPVEKKAPPLSAAEKRERRRQREQMIADLKGVYDNKLRLTVLVCDWVHKYADYCNLSHQKTAFDIKNKKAELYSGQISSSMCRSVSLAETLVYDSFQQLHYENILAFKPDYEQLMYIDIECEIQEPIILYERISHMLEAYSKKMGWATSFSPLKYDSEASFLPAQSQLETARHQRFSNNAVSQSNLTVGISRKADSKFKQNASIPCDQDLLLSAALGSSETQRYEVMSTDIDETRCPVILFSPELGSSKSVFTEVVFECYLELGSLIFRRVEALLRSIRVIEKQFLFSISCLNLSQRSDADFEDLVYDEYESLKKRVESSVEKTRNMSVKDMDAEALIALVKKTKSLSDDLSQIDLSRLTDPHATSEYLFSAMKYFSLYALTLFYSALDIMSLWGWDISCEDFKEREDYLLEPNSRGKKNIYIRLMFACARTEMVLGRYREAESKFEQLLSLFTMSNYTMFRKITIQMIKCFLIRGDYSHALDFIHRLGFKELPASISIFDSSEINMIKILKENRELGFYFLMAQAGIKRLVDSGYQTAEKCRVFFMHKNGILDRGTEYSVEVYEGGRFDDSKLKEFEKEEAVKRIENENEVNLNEFRLLAKEANIRASKLLLEIQEVMGEKDPVII